MAPCETVILRRGLDTFAELGYEASTVRELAKRLDVSHNFINDRYGSKACFWRAVVDFAAQGLLEQLQAAIDLELDDGDCLANVVLCLHRIAAHNPQVNRIIADESVRDSDRLDYLYERYAGKFWEQVSPIVQRLMDAGRMPRVPVDLVFFAISGPALTLTHGQLARRLAPPGTDADQDPARRAELLAHLVLNGLLPAVGANDR